MKFKFIQIIFNQKDLNDLKGRIRFLSSNMFKNLDNNKGIDVIEFYELISLKNAPEYFNILSESYNVIKQNKISIDVSMSPTKEMEIVSPSPMDKMEL